MHKILCIAFISFFSFVLNSKHYITFVERRNSNTQNIHVYAVSKLPIKKIVLTNKNDNLNFTASNVHLNNQNFYSIKLGRHITLPRIKNKNTVITVYFSENDSPISSITYNKSVREKIFTSTRSLVDNFSIDFQPDLDNKVLSVSASDNFFNMSIQYAGVKLIKSNSTYRAFYYLNRQFKFEEEYDRWTRKLKQHKDHFSYFIPADNNSTVYPLNIKNVLDIKNENVTAHHINLWQSRTNYVRIALNKSVCINEPAQRSSVSDSESMPSHKNKTSYLLHQIRDTKDEMCLIEDERPQEIIENNVLVNEDTDSDSTDNNDDFINFTDLDNDNGHTTNENFSDTSNHENDRNYDNNNSSEHPNDGHVNNKIENNEIINFDDDEIINFDEDEVNEENIIIENNSIREHIINNSFTLTDNIPENTYISNVNLDIIDDNSLSYANDQIVQMIEETSNDLFLNLNIENIIDNINKYSIEQLEDILNKNLELRRQFYPAAKRAMHNKKYNFSQEQKSKFYYGMVYASAHETDTSNKLDSETGYNLAEDALEYYGFYNTRQRGLIYYYRAVVGSYYYRNDPSASRFINRAQEYQDKLPNNFSALLDYYSAMNMSFDKTVSDKNKIYSLEKALKGKKYLPESYLAKLHLRIMMVGIHLYKNDNKKKNELVDDVYRYIDHLKDENKASVLYQRAVVKNYLDRDDYENNLKAINDVSPYEKHLPDDKIGALRYNKMFTTSIYFKKNNTPSEREKANILAELIEDVNKYAKYLPEKQLNHLRALELSIRNKLEDFNKRKRDHIRDISNENYDRRKKYHADLHPSDKGNIINSRSNSYRNNSYRNN